MTNTENTSATPPSELMTHLAAMNLVDEYTKAVHTHDEVTIYGGSPEEIQAALLERVRTYGVLVARLKGVAL